MPITRTPSRKRTDAERRDSKRVILRALNGDPLQTGEIASTTGLSPHAVRTTCLELVDAKLVEVRGEKSQRRWALRPDIKIAKALIALALAGCVAPTAEPDPAECDISCFAETVGCQRDARECYQHCVADEQPGNSTCWLKCDRIAEECVDDTVACLVEAKTAAAGGAP